LIRPGADKQGCKGNPSNQESVDKTSQPKKRRVIVRRQFSHKSLWVAALLPALAFGCGWLASRDEKSRDLRILQRWAGDYPLAQLDRLPEGQRLSRVGYLGDAAAFTQVWQAFKPGTPVPTLDFSKNLVVFARNVDLYRRMLIVKVTLTRGVAEIVDVESASEAPLEEKFAIALALISRDGIEFILRGEVRIPVR
jgi:hypothetical protein